MTETTTGTRKPAAKARPEEKPRGRGVRSVAEMLPDIGGVAFRKFGFVQSSIVSRWGEIVGERYADVSAPEMIRFPPGKRKDGTLILAVNSGYAPMMQHVCPVIIERVNRFFGYAAITRIAIKQGAIKPPEPRRAPPSLKPVPVELGESLRAISDPELRDCLAALAGAVAASEGVPRIGRTLPIRSKE